jgi:hypothetical protein
MAQPKNCSLEGYDMGPVALSVCRAEQRFSSDCSFETPAFRRMWDGTVLLQRIPGATVLQKAVKWNCLVA